MTDDLYRKEALEHRTRSLYGDVILTAPPTTWIVTFILVIVMALIVALLVIAQIDGAPLWKWLLGRAA